MEVSCIGDNEKLGFKFGVCIEIVCLLVFSELLFQIIQTAFFL